MYETLKPLLFKLGPESSHDITIALLSSISNSNLLCNLSSKIIGGAIPADTKVSSVEAMGISFPNPLGLAAGLDKNASACNALDKMGFGWLELGTVTPLPQPGNPKPRIFRIPEHNAVINRLGFNSAGLKGFLRNIKRANPKTIKGINIGKNAVTSLSNAVDDYLICLRGVYPYADYITINISSPNTQDLRKLQQDRELNKLLNALTRERENLADGSGRRVPLVVKIAPDMQIEQIDGIAEILRKNEIDGVAATNTTVSRDKISDHPMAREVGGLSGMPMREASTQVIHQLYKNLQGEIPIIGIGGIDSAEAAKEKLDAGAKLIQIYTGLIYKGPGLVSEILKSLNSENN